MSKSVDIRQAQRVAMPTTYEKIDRVIIETIRSLVESMIVPLQNEHGSEEVTTEGNFEHIIFIRNGDLFVEVKVELRVPDVVEVETYA
jgi:hypothetical protein